MEVTFNELNISRDSTTLTLYATLVNGADEHFVISRVAVDTCATFNEMLGHPSDSAIINLTEETDTGLGGLSVSYEWTEQSAFRNKILFVWIGCTDEAAQQTVYRLAAVVNWFDVYNKAMSFVKKLGCGDCTPPFDFVDFILKTKGIEYALQTGNAGQAVKLWKTMVTKPASSVSAGDCGCGCG